MPVLAVMVMLVRMVVGAGLEGASAETARDGGANGA